jgi:hypothetical protein
MSWNLLSAILLNGLLAVSCTATALAAPPQFQGASADGSVVFFTTDERLVPGDTDNRIDVYKRSFEPGVGAGGEYVTRQLSNGPTGGNDAVDAIFQAASESGTLVFFQTAEPLVAADTDRSTDVYARTVGTGALELVTVAGTGQNGAADASFAGATPGGDKVLFLTSQAFSSSDLDGSAADLYERDLSGDQTNLVSAPAAGCSTCEAGSFPTFSAVSDGGERAFFATAGKLAGEDTDSALDIYARDLPGGPTQLISTGEGACLPACGNDSSEDAVFAGSSDDGSAVFFETAEALADADDDLANDVYGRVAATTTLLSPGSANVSANVSRQSTFEPAISDDGSKVFFETTEALPGDSDQANDVYEYSDGGVQRVTPNGCTGAGCGVTYAAITPDGSILAFSSAEQLTPNDGDTSFDLYLTPTAGGSPDLVSIGASSCSPSCGNEDPFDVVFNWISSDGSLILFSSKEQLAALDGDANFDPYARDVADEETTLVSVPEVCSAVAGCDSGFTGASEDGSRVFFQTAERLDPDDDTDTEVDLYERDRDTGTTRLISRKNEATIGPGIPILTGTDPISPGASTTPGILGHSDPGTTIKLYAGAGCQGLPLQTQTPATAGQLEGTGIVISVGPGTTTTLSASAADAEGVDSACSPSLLYTQQDPTSPPAEEGGGGGGTGTTSGGTGTGTGTGSGGTRRGHPGIVYVAPAVRISFGPAAKTRVRRPVFRFLDATGQPGSSFLCKVDRRRWKPCQSPFKLPRLSFGSHVFSVNAVNALGVSAQAPVRRKFKVVR